MLEDVFIGLVLMQEAQFRPCDPYQGIPPPDSLEDDEEAQVQVVAVDHMSGFVEENGRMLLQVRGADEDGFAEGEGGMSVAQQDGLETVDPGPLSLPGERVDPRGREEDVSQHGQGACEIEGP